MAWQNVGGVSPHMSNSTTGDKSKDGDVDIGPSVDELFGDIADDPAGTDETDRQNDREQGEDETVEDRTANDVFAQLQSESGSDGDEVLESESPEDIIDAADEHEPTDEREVDLLVDEGALDDLLLSERTRGEEFLWVDSGDGPADPNTTEESSVDASTETDANARPDATDESPPDDSRESTAGADHPDYSLRVTDEEGPTVVDADGEAVDWINGETSIADVVSERLEGAVTVETRRSGIVGPRRATVDDRSTDGTEGGPGGDADEVDRSSAAAETLDETGEEDGIEPELETESDPETESNGVESPSGNPDDASEIVHDARGFTFSGSTPSSDDDPNAPVLHDVEKSGDDGANAGGVVGWIKSLFGRLF